MYGGEKISQYRPFSLLFARFLVRLGSQGPGKPAAGTGLEDLATFIMADHALFFRTMIALQTGLLWMGDPGICPAQGFISRYGIMEIVS